MSLTPQKVLDTGKGSMNICYYYYFKMTHATNKSPVDSESSPSIETQRTRQQKTRLLAWSKARCASPGHLSWRKKAIWELKAKAMTPGCLRKSPGALQKLWVPILLLQLVTSDSLRLGPRHQCFDVSQVILTVQPDLRTPNVNHSWTTFNNYLW